MAIIFDLTEYLYQAKLRCTYEMLFDMTGEEFNMLWMTNLSLHKKTISPEIKSEVRYNTNYEHNLH